MAAQALANVEYRPTEITTERLGAIMVKSGFFKDLREEAQAIVKILYGQELGFGPMASVMGVYIVDGRPSLSAQLIASAVQRSGRFRYRVREWTASVCRIEFFECDESLGFSSFTLEEATAAQLAGKGVWKSYPKAMLWARAMSQGARAFVPEVFLGPIYTPEELGADVDGEGRVIDVPMREHTVDRTTGEVLDDPAPFVPTRERDVDDESRAQPTAQITRSDSPIWKLWMELSTKAPTLGIAVATFTLPCDRAALEKAGIELANKIHAEEAKRVEALP